jgi:hypothetical protein
MAKEQGLSLSPVKISGTCGRLMCCLKYEQDAYTDLINKTPKVGQTVKTPQGNGVVVDVALLTGTIKVKMEGSVEEAAPQVFNLKQLKIVGGKKCCCKNQDDNIPEFVEEDFQEITEEDIIPQSYDKKPEKKYDRKDNKQKNKQNPKEENQENKRNHKNNKRQNYQNRGKRPYRNNKSKRDNKPKNESKA